MVETPRCLLCILDKSPPFGTSPSIAHALGIPPIKYAKSFVQYGGVLQQAFGNYGIDIHSCGQGSTVIPTWRAIRGTAYGLSTGPNPGIPRTVSIKRRKQLPDTRLILDDGTGTFDEPLDQRLCLCTLSKSHVDFGRRDVDSGPEPDGVCCNRL